MPMFPPLFDTVKSDAAVKAVFGNSPRIYPHGRAPDKGDPLYRTPYAVHQIVSGSPENFLAGRPDADGFTTQIDVYAEKVEDAAHGAEVLRDAIEPVAYIVGWRGQFKDPDTSLFRYSFDVDWLTPR